MTAQPKETVLKREFLEKAADALEEEGFVTDEHDFAPYRETIAEYYRDIQSALAERGYHFELLPGFVQHRQAGYAYFIYDSHRFATLTDAQHAVSAWLNEQYGK